MSSGCQRCGLSCEGVRVVLQPGERALALERLAALGIAWPEEGGALRRVGGRCVAYDAGCRLHATFGADAKPAVCRQFPYARAGEVIGVDPACAHADAFSPVGWAPLGVDAPGPLLPATLAEQATALGLTIDEAAARWREIGRASCRERV